MINKGLLVMSQKKQRDDHNTVRLPESLTNDMDKLIGTRGFTSRAEIAKQAIRDYLDRIRLQTPQLPRFERINADSSGVLIFDRQLTGNRSVHISFKPTGIKCDYHGSSTCEHVRFALEQSDVQKIVRQKQKEGWNIELPE